MATPIATPNSRLLINKMFLESCPLREVPASGGSVSERIECTHIHFPYLNDPCSFRFLISHNFRCVSMLTMPTNWASEASPTLGCSIEISLDIICACVSVVCQINCVGGIT